MPRAFVILLAIGLIGCVSERSEGPVAPEIWQQVFGGEGVQEVYCVTACSDGGFVAAGYSVVSGPRGDLYAFKMTASGELAWDLVLSSDGYDVAQSIVATDDGGYVIWGLHNSYSRLIKLDESGSVVWERSVNSGYDGPTGPPQQQRAGRLANAGDGGFVLVTPFGDALIPGTKIRRFDRLGELQWDSSYYRPTGLFPGALAAGHQIVSCAGGGYISVGGGDMGWLGCDGFMMAVLRIQESGQRQWHQIPAPLPDGWGAAGECVVPSSNGWIVGGEVTQRLPSDEVLGDLYLVKVDDTGGVVWTKQHEREGLQAVTFGIPIAGGGGCVIGREASSGSVHYAGPGEGCPREELIFENSDGFVCWFDDTGEVMWCRTYGGVGEDCLHSGAQLKDGGFVFVGSTESFGAQEKDFYIIKTDAGGNTSGSP